jgi:hypothetical protein
MSKLRAGVDKLEVDDFECRALGVHQKRLSQGDDALLGSNAAALDHEEVIVDFSVMRETAHWGDRLVGDVVLGGCVVLDNLNRGVIKQKLIGSSLKIEGNLYENNEISPIIW